MLPRRRFLLFLLLATLFIFQVFIPASRSQATNHSVLLNGTSAYVDVPFNSNLNITGALTLEAWVKTNSTAYQHVLERGDWWQDQMSYDLTLSEGKVRLDIMQSNGSYASVTGNTPLSLNAWHHIAGVYDGSQMRVYLDGVLNGTAAATIAPGSNTTGLRIGKSSFLYFPNYFNGRIDEVRISNTAVYSSNFTPSVHLSATASTKGLCGQFISGVLKQIGSDKKPAHSSNALEIFDAVKKQGGFGRRELSNSAEGASTLGNEDAFININFAITDNVFSRADAGRVILHELVHVGSSTSEFFSHYEMFKAADAVARSQGGFQLTKKPSANDPKGVDLPDAYAFNDLLFQACNLRRRR